MNSSRHVRYGKHSSSNLLDLTYASIYKDICIYFCVIFILLSFVRMIVAEEDFYLSPSISLNHGVNLPRIGLGTAGLRQSTRDIVYEALGIGMVMIDTAQAQEWYDESQVGRGIQDYLQSSTDRKLVSNIEDITIVTKIHPRSFEYDKMKAKLTESRNLLLGEEDRPLDVVLLHSPYCWRGHCTPEEEAVSWKDGWINLESMQSVALVLNIGVSNFDLPLLQDLVENIANVKVSVVQNWMDPFHQDYELREYCRQHDITYMAYSSFGTQWEWKLEHNPAFLNPVLDQIARKHESSIAKVILSWLMQEGVVAIPRSSSIDHLHDNASLLDVDYDSMTVRGIQVFLDEDDMHDIRSLDGILGSLWD